MTIPENGVEVGRIPQELSHAQPVWFAGLEREWRRAPGQRRRRCDEFSTNTGVTVA
jgi:hypothetical protein